MWSASASESSWVIGPTSRRMRPRLSSSCVRSVGSSGRRSASLIASTPRSYAGTVRLGQRTCRARRRVSRRRAADGAASSSHGGASPRAGARGRFGGLRRHAPPRDGESLRGASRRAARPRAPGSATGSARPAQLHATPAPPLRYPSLLDVRERCRCLDVEDGLDACRGLLSVLTAGPLERETLSSISETGRETRAPPSTTAHRLTLHGVHSAGHRRRPPRLGRADPGRRRGGRRAARCGPRAPLRLEQLDSPASAAGRGASPHGVHTRGCRAADTCGCRCARAGRKAGAGSCDDVDRPRSRRTSSS